MKEKIEKHRESNIELLRIISMLLITVHHFFVYGGLWMLPPVSVNKMIVNALLPFGKIGFDCFVVISCWFMVKTEFKGERLLKVWFQVLFYNIILTIAAIMMKELNSADAIKVLLGALFPMIGNSHGFAAAYIAFYAMLPIIKRIQSGLNQKQAIYVVCFFGGTQIAARIVGYLIGYTQQFQNEFLLFVFVYFLMYYLQNWPVKRLQELRTRVLLLAGTLLLIIGNSIMTQFSNHWLVSFLQWSTSSEFSLLCIFAGGLIFSVFKSIRITYSRVINSIAATTFGILLFHDHNYFRVVLWKPFKDLFDWEALQPIQFLVISIIISMTVFLMGMVVDFARKIVFERRVLSSETIHKYSERISLLWKTEENA